jgi:hypothetical protein
MWDSEVNWRRQAYTRYYCHLLDIIVTFMRVCCVNPLRPEIYRSQGCRMWSAGRMWLCHGCCSDSLGQLCTEGTGVFCECFGVYLVLWLNKAGERFSPMQQHIINLYNKCHKMLIIFILRHVSTLYWVIFRFFLKKKLKAIYNWKLYCLG